MQSSCWLTFVKLLMLSEKELDTLIAFIQTFIEFWESLYHILVDPANI